eukprot:ANDGO_00150.mRNA.1 hypothetical protein
MQTLASSIHHTHNSAMEEKSAGGSGGPSHTSRIGLLFLHLGCGMLLVHYWRMFTPYPGIVMCALTPLTVSYVLFRAYQKPHSLPLFFRRILMNPLFANRPRMFLSWLAGFTVVCSLLITYYIMHSLRIWCAFSPIYQKRMCDASAEVHKTLDAAGIKMWLGYGSVLGLVRHNRMPIPWEHDFDALIRPSDVGAAIEALRKHGYDMEIVRSGTGIRIPFDDGGLFPAREGEAKITDLWTYPITQKDFDELQLTQFCGHTFWSWKDPQKYLVELYGESYMTVQFDHLAGFCAIHVDETW